MIDIPRLNSRGPIEARIPGVVRSELDCIPRLNSRGPIEAPSNIKLRGGDSRHSAAEQPRPH